LSFESPEKENESTLLDKNDLSGSSSDEEFVDEDIILGVWTWNING